MQFARDLDPALANRFVGMYVNERTLNYGDDGREAIRKLLDMGYERGIIPHKAQCRLRWLTSSTATESSSEIERACRGLFFSSAVSGSRALPWRTLPVVRSLPQGEVQVWTRSSAGRAFDS